MMDGQWCNGQWTMDNSQTLIDCSFYVGRFEDFQIFQIKINDAVDFEDSKRKNRLFFPNLTVKISSWDSHSLTVNGKKRIIIYYLK
jgi:hypothetical protein